MLRLERHLSEDELLALRDGRDDDFVRVSHLEDCTRCQKRLGFMSAFKAAVQTSLESGPPAPKRGTKESLLFSTRCDARVPLPLAEAPPPSQPVYPSAPPPKPAEDHPDPATLAAYFDGALKGRERSRVQRHLLGCERCMADTLVLVAGRGEGVAGEDLRAARAYFHEHGSAIAYTQRSARQVRPQLELRLQDGIGKEVDFRILARPGRTSRARLPSRDVDDRIEVMVETVRVTVTAHRDGRIRFLDVQLRDIGRPAYPPAATVSLEEEGRTVDSVRTDSRGKASLRVPDLRCFDLRVSGGWTIPVLLRFRA